MHYQEQLAIIRRAQNAFNTIERDRRRSLAEIGHARDLLNRARNCADPDIILQATELLEDQANS